MDVVVNLADERQVLTSRIRRIVSRAEKPGLSQRLTCHLSFIVGQWTPPGGHLRDVELRVYIRSCTAARLSTKDIGTVSYTRERLLITFHSSSSTSRCQLQIIRTGSSSRRRKAGPMTLSTEALVPTVRPPSSGCTLLCPYGVPI